MECTTALNELYEALTYLVWMFVTIFPFYAGAKAADWIRES